MKKIVIGPISVEQIGGFYNLEDTNSFYNNMDKITLVVESGYYVENIRIQKWKKPN